MSDKIQNCFERFEKKYFITRAQYSEILARMQSRMKADRFGKYTVCNIYYDTDDWRLIRASIEKPVYKEKLRVRSYGTPTVNDTVFIELKKKYKGVVYKRRVTAAANLTEHILYDALPVNAGQIEREIKWFQDYYNTKPKVFIAYDRTAYAGIDAPGLRITFDTNMRWRTYDLDLCLGDHGEPLISSDRILMEIKFLQSAPLWLSQILSETCTFPVTFSKYGTCYREHIINKKERKQEVLLYA